MKRKLRVLMIAREGLVPPPDAHERTDKEMLPWKSEYDVMVTLRNMGHEVEIIGVLDDLNLIRDSLAEMQPHIVFNLLEEFHNTPLYESYVVSYFGLLQQPYTGCNPRGLLLSRDKVLGKKILHYHRIATPHFVAVPRGRVPAGVQRLRYPLLVKSATEDASFGISQASVIRNREKLLDRIAYIHDEIGTSALVEEYIEGREIYLAMLGNHRLSTFTPWELDLSNLPASAERIATERVKWSEDYQKKYRIMTGPARDLPPGIEKKIAAIGRRVYRALSMSGYGRIDFRLHEDGTLFVLEANPNPNLSFGEDFAESIETAGVSYERLLSRIVQLGLTWQAE